MTTEALLKDYTTYNLWANELIVNWLRTKPDELMEKPVPSSFPSLRATLMHIWAAEFIWLERLQNISPTDFLSDTFKGTNPQLFEHVLQNSETFKNFIHRQSEEYFDNATVYKHTNGKQFQQPNAEIILHCMQHSSYHRGQIVTIARNLGITDPPKTDFIEYARQKQIAV